MPAPATTLLIEGTFRELVEELADYIDNLKKTQGGDTSTSLRTEVTPLLEEYVQAEESNDADKLETTRDAVLKVLVQNSAALNHAPEREFIAAYNLLIHLVQQSPNLNEYLQPICRNLSGDITSSTNYKSGLALSILSTVFNILPPDESIRYPVFTAILDIVGKSGNFELLRPQLKYLDGWLSQWQSSPAQQRRLYMRVSSLARESNEDEEAYDYHVRALRTITSAETSSEEARKLSVDALKTALASPTHFDFEDLTALDSIQALRNSDPNYFELLEIFTSQLLDDYNEFKEEHPGWVEEQKLDDALLVRKMRLLTLASLGASASQTRSLPYSAIAKALQIPEEDVEMWVIDVIRAGLVEGKLSQLNQTFLIHRSTHRVFTETQWREVAGRLNMWRTSLMNVLGVIRQEKESMIMQKEQELRAADARVNGAGADRGGGGGYRRQQQQQRDTFDITMD